MKKLLFIVVTLIFVSSCTIDPCLTKGQFINGYNTFTEKVFEEHKDYKKADWEDKDEKMNQFIDECYKKHEEKFSDDEKKSFWIKYFKYKFYRHGRSFIKAIESDVEDFSLEIDEELEDLFENPEEDLKKILSELYGDDIEEALDDVLKGINDIADKIKEWINNEE